MSWFGEGLSTLKGQLQNFTKEVLSDEGEEISGDRPSELLEAKQKFQELEALCEAQNLEISALRKQVSQLQKEPRDGSSEVVNDSHNESWWTVEHRCDPGYSNGTKEAPIAATDDRTKLKTHTLEKSPEEKDDIINRLKDQLLQMQKESQKVHDLERKIEQLQLERNNNHSETQTVPDNHSAVSQPDIIHGTTGTLEQENKILKQRIAELELLIAPNDVGKEENKMTKNDESVEDSTGLISCEYLKSEIEALEKVIQDLESQLAEVKAENDNLNSNMDELDKQHQAAIDQLLLSKSILQRQNDKLQSELQELKLNTDEQMSLKVELQSLLKENSTLKDDLKAVKDINNDLMSVENKINFSVSEDTHFDAVDNFKSEFRQKFMSVITCDIPKDLYSNKDDLDIINTAEALNKMCADYKWKKETLERKVVEMMNEIALSKQNLTDHKETITVLENECKILRSSVESLVEELHTLKNGADEVLAPIPENSEETEALAQKVTTLENEVDILREARTNLEADAAKLREHESILVKQLQSTEAALRNQENIQREMAKWQETADNANRQMRELMDSKLELETEVQKLRMQQDLLQELQCKNENLLSELSRERNEKQTLTGKLAEYENLKCLLEAKISCLEERISTASLQLSDNKVMFSEMQEQLRITEEKLLAADNNQISIQIEHDLLRKMVAQKDEEISTVKNEVEELCNELKTAYVNAQIYFKCREDELHAAKTQIHVSEKLNKLLHSKINVEYIDLEVLVKNEALLQRKMIEIENFGSEEKNYINQLINELGFKEHKLVVLDQEVAKLRLHEEKWKKDVETIGELQEECKKLRLQLNIKDEEVLSIKQMLATSEYVSALLHKKLNMNYEGIEALQHEGSYIQQHINDIENARLRDENYLKHLVYKLQQKDTQIQELKTYNDLLEKKLKNNLEEKWDTNSQYENLSMENVQNSEKNELTCKQTTLDTVKEFNETLQPKCKLREQHERVVAIQDNIQSSEHFDRELSEHMHLCDERDNQQVEEKLSQSDSKQQCENCRADSQNTDTAQKELENVRQLLSVKDKELTNKQDQILELQLECQKLYDDNKEIIYWKSELAATQEKLKEEMKHKNDIIASLDKLKIAEKELTTMRFQEKELKEFQESILVLKTKYDEVYSSKLKLEDELRKCRFTDAANVILTNNDTVLSSDILKENVWLEKESNKLAALIATEKSSVPRLQEENSESKNLIKLQHEEVAVMAKETIANLSKIIKDKDIEIADIKEKIEKNVVQIENLQQKISQLQFEKDELVKTIHIKHQESIQYHEEIQRLSGLLSQEFQKSQEIQQQHKGLLKQHEDKQKLLINTQNEVISLKQRLERLEASYISQSSNAEIEGNVPIREGNHTDELKSVIASKDQIIEKIVSKLTLCEQELKLKQQEIDVLREQSQSTHNAYFMFENNIEGHSIEDHPSLLSHNMAESNNSMEHTRVNTLLEQVKQLEQECHHLTGCLQEQQTKTKYLEDDILERKEREASLEKELERLREHLVTVEESYTQEMLRAEQQAHSLQARLNDAEERLKSSSTAYTSASILVNQQVEALQNQTQSLTQQRDEAFSKLSAAEDKVQKHEAALRNLQAVLEQFQRDKEREISAEVMKVQKLVHASEKKQEEFIEEIQALKMQLGKANDGLSAAARLGEEIDRKTETIASLKEKVKELTEKLEKTEQLAQLQAATENKVDRNLMKNLIVGYFSAPAAGRTQVLRVLASVLEMCPDDLTKLGIGCTNPASNQSLSEAFIRFLENESRPQPKLRLLPQTQEHEPRDRSSPSPSTSSTGSRRSPLLLSEVHLPTFTQFPAVRSSSSILKDVLKES